MNGAALVEEQPVTAVREPRAFDVEDRPRADRPQEAKDSVAVSPPTKSKNLDRRIPKKKNGVSYTFLAAIDLSQMDKDVRVALKASRYFTGHVEYVAKTPGAPPLRITHSNCFVKEYRHNPPEVCIYKSENTQTSFKVLPMSLKDFDF
jgi:hypothetical protein